MTSTLPILSGGEKGIPFSPPTRFVEFEMDMNISETAIASFLGENVGDQCGDSVSIVGDVNGDGFNDIAIAAIGYGGVGSGETFLFLGSAFGWALDTYLDSADASFAGERSGDNSGSELSPAGDVNGDGYDDFLIGAKSNSEAGGSAGQVYLILGKATGWAMHTNLSNADASFWGEEPSDSAGSSATISCAGDVNGDGYDDIIMGSYGYQSNTGKVYLVLGKATGWAMDTDLSTSDATFIAEGTGDWAGCTVDGAGDVNGDGYDDLIIGASDNAGDTNKGKAYLFFGKGSGWAQDTQLSSADASFIGEADFDYLGSFVAGPGDVNGDGYDDLLIYASNNDEAASDFGQTYLVLGKSSGWATNVDIGGVDASFLGEYQGSWQGRGLSKAGDLDGDGYDDIVIGYETASEVDPMAGQVYIIYGKGSDWSMDADLSDSDASFIGESFSSHLGFSIAGGGDANGDGNDDLLIGATGAGDGGKTYLVSLEGFSEPSEVYTVEVKNQGGIGISSADIGETVQVELTGLDGDPTHQDRARVNFTFGTKLLKVPLFETGLNTGLYRGTFTIPLSAKYLEYSKFSAYVDPSKYKDILIDYPFRPKTITSVGVFEDSKCINPCNMADFYQTITFEVKGIDENSIMTDKAFVILTSDKDPSLEGFMVLDETGTSTGTYRGSFKIPTSMQYFENITITSLENPAKTARFKVHTPVQIRSNDASVLAYEDLEYTATFFNFGYSPVTWNFMKGETYWLNWDAQNKTMIGTPTNFHVGPWKVRVKAQDTEGHSFTYYLNLTVVNAPPNIVTENVLSVKEDALYSVDYDSDDDLEGNITWELTTSAQWISIDKNSGLITGTPSNDDVGTVPVKIVVDDGNSGKGFTQFNLTVININQRPHIITEDIFSIDQDTPFRRDYEVSDPDSEDTHFWILTTDAAWLSLESDTGVLSGTPTGQDVGTFSVNVTVLDSGGLYDSHLFDLTVVDVKDKPAWIDVPAKDIEVPNGIEFVFDANATDYDGDTITYSVSTMPVSAMTINTVTGLIRWTASLRSLPKGTDDLVVTIQASDGELFSPYVFNIHILATEPPNSTLLLPMDGARTSSMFTLLTWSGSDPENEEISYTLYLSDSETFVMGKLAECRIFEDWTVTEYNASDLGPGKTYYWTVIPSDGGSDGTCADGIHSFRVNSPPKISPLVDVSATTGKSFKLKVTVTDDDAEDAQDLKFFLTRYPEGMTIDKDTGVIRWKPTTEQAGDRSATVEVTDGIDTVSYPFNINVKQGEESEFPVIPLLIGLVILLIIIGIVLFFVLRKKPEKEDEEQEKDETEEILSDIEKRKQKDELMGQKAPDVVKSDVPLTLEEAHANLGKDRPKTYEEMYGTPAPKKEEALTTEELKEEIGKMAEELEEIESAKP